ncbi:MAG TPA: outer membrane beta-barrel protein [Candidatus Polarisedimenticolia bacterium]|nr:outer membrane beta-barrel protein [Candidatus Polarisedimenticolia bacterium]
MRSRLASLLLLSSALLATPAFAVPGVGHPIQIGFGGGASIPVSDAKDAFHKGWHGSGIIRLNVPMMPFGLQGNFTYNHFKLDEQNVGFPGSGRILSGIADARFSLPIPGPIKPYLLAGVGTYNIKADPEGSGAPSTDSVTKFGINGGGGVTLDFPGLPIHAFLEGKVENIYTDEGLNQAVVSDFKTQIIPVTFGIFLF